MKDGMDDFFLVFEQMKRQGPGSDESTLKAFNAIADSEQIRTVADMGCGKGVQTMALARNCNALITAIDTHQPFLDHLEKKADQSGLSGQINCVNMSMAAPALPAESMDLIWAEGSAYNMGFENALETWRPLIRPNGYLFVSEAVWLEKNPAPALLEYWNREYPDMQDVFTREDQAGSLGYDIVSSFVLPRKEWDAFYHDMKTSLDAAVNQKGMTPVFEAIQKEIDIDRRYGEAYSYLYLLLRRKD